jgi:transposase
MAAKPPADTKILSGKLDAILNAVRDLIIVEGAKGGMSRDQVRKMLGVSPARVTRVWKHLKKVMPQQTPPKPQKER